MAREKVVIETRIVPLPAREKRGAKPQDDSGYIALAVEGYAAGIYINRKHAASILSKLDGVSPNACYRRLLRKLPPHCEVAIIME